MTQAPPITLADFLLGCLAEDTHRAEQAYAMGHREWPSPDWILADCAAKRALIGLAVGYSPELKHGDNGEWAFDVALRSLALAYTDRSGFRGEWRA